MKLQVSVLNYLLFSLVIFSIFSFSLYFWSTSLQTFKNQKSKLFLENFKESLELSGIISYSVCNYCSYQIILRTKTFLPRIHQPIAIYDKNQFVVYSFEDKEVYSTFYNLTNNYIFEAAATLDKNIILDFSYFLNRFLISNID